VKIYRVIRTKLNQLVYENVRISATLQRKWCPSKKHFAQLDLQHDGKTAGIDMIWRNYVSVTLCIRKWDDALTRYSGEMKSECRNGDRKGERNWVNINRMALSKMAGLICRNDKYVWHLRTYRGAAVKQTNQQTWAGLLPSEKLGSACSYLGAAWPRVSSVLAPSPTPLVEADEGPHQLHDAT